jgi:hypothetical protein
LLIRGFTVFHDKTYAAGGCSSLAAAGVLKRQAKWCIIYNRLLPVSHNFVNIVV